MVEHSLDAILELLKEFEEDEPPTQPEIHQALKEPQEKPSSYRHRFAIYCKTTGSYAQGSPAIQLQLFTSFAKA